MKYKFSLQQPRKHTNTLISTIHSGMLALLLVTFLFMILKFFEFDKGKEFLNEKLPFTVVTIGLWVGLLYVIRTRNKERNGIMQMIQLYGYLFLVAHTICLAFLAIQSHFDILYVFSWIYWHVGHFVLSVIVVYVLYLLVYHLLGKLFLSTVLTSCSLIIFAIVNYLKILFRGDPLYPADFTQIVHLKSVIPMVLEPLEWKYVLLGIICIVLSILLLLYIRKHTEPVKVPISMRLFGIITSIFILYVYSNYTNTFMSKLFQKWGVEFILWNQNENYANNGFVLGFISNLDTTIMEEPKGYSKEKMVQIANDIKKKYGENIGEQNNEAKPNVIYIMSEAFWDPTKLMNLSFSEDPIPHLHHYIENFPGGQTISPTFGGNTANTEFEALTSYSMSFLKPGSIPYQQAITNQNEVPSIVSSLKKEGYYATAIHSYGRSFFKRDTVYHVLGFDTFHAEDTMKYTDIDGDYISDISMSKEIIEELKRRTQPTFIHAVTMQNHFPFTPGRFGENRTEIHGLTEDASKAELETYTEGIRRSDEALQYLIEELDKLGKPTILVFFGDHLPSLGTNKSLYKEAGYIENETSVKERLAMAETPLLLYANFNLPNDNLGRVSPVYFSNLVFDYAELKKPVFYQFLSKLYEEIPVLRDELKVNQDGTHIEKLTNKQKEMLEQYKLIQYDLLVGKQYSKKIIF
ncbi:LTA synthase family protein [Bacillus cytotoxicus]|uniref:LTA synthase family protein n=1 Tax=Bacillus cytotoxicus TaxID=580165 RepID=UPI000660371E|nr:LTA synthase family protein [Bacillus cytotoxicus]AWC34299.1 phosphoglycerol transferase [Bacillus cytotoxicus]AWC38298.1 phosphoglycerol transferase [Bacillus cytotoxicus]AWC62515.1 phosphoglycerol transferase [Bacillus cytotoxicus]KMT51776.1 phosphoglycerol transferase [Bacillus cytotoxicus]HDR7310469.1 LTA synthase family protein [Bacillus cytotoxicus]